MDWHPPGYGPLTAAGIRAQPGNPLCPTPRRWLRGRGLEEDCEVVSLKVMLPGAGVGSALLGAVEKVAADHGAKRVVVITSNDNLSALRFYQLRGYRMVAVLVGAIDAARESKPDDSCVLG